PTAIGETLTTSVVSNRWFIPVHAPPSESTVVLVPPSGSAVSVRQRRRDSTYVTAITAGFPLSERVSCWLIPVISIVVAGSPSASERSAGSNERPSTRYP